MLLVTQDSAVHDWVNQCEATYQAFVARIAQYDEDGKDSVVSELSRQSLDDDDDVISLHASSPASAMPSTPSDKADAKSPTSLAAASAKSAARQGASRSQTMRGDGVSCTSNISRAATRAQVAPASKDTASVDTLAKSDTADCRLSTAEIDAKAVLPLSLRTGSPIAATAIARSTSASRGVEENPVDEEASVTERRPPPFPTDGYDRRQAASGTIDAYVSSGGCYPVYPGKPHREESDNREPRDGAGACRSGDEKSATARPEVAESHHNSNGDSPTTFPPVPPLVTGRDHRRSPSSPPSQLRRSESTPLEVPTDRQKTATVPLSFSRFAESLPDTCDVFGQDSPAQAPAKSNVLIATPPALPPSAEVQRVEPARLDSVFGGASGGLPGAPGQDPNSDGPKMRCAKADARDPREGVPFRDSGISQRKAPHDASSDHDESTAEEASPQHSSFGRPGDGKGRTFRSEQKEGSGGLVDAESGEDSVTNLDEPSSKGREERVSSPKQPDYFSGSAAGVPAGMSLGEESCTRNDVEDDDTHSPSSSPPTDLRQATKPTPPNASVDSLTQRGVLADKNVGDEAVKPRSMALNSTTAEEDTEKEACDTSGAVPGALGKSVQQDMSSTPDSPSQGSVPLIPAAHLPCSSPVPSPSSGKVTSPACSPDPRRENNVIGSVCNQMGISSTDADHEQCSDCETGSSVTMAMDSPGTNENKGSTANQEGGALHQLAELASLERMAPSRSGPLFPDGGSEPPTTGTSVNEFPTDGGSKQGTAGSFMKETAGIVAEDRNSAKSGLQVTAGEERLSSRPTSRTPDTPLTKPLYNEGNEDEDSSTIAAVELQSATPELQSATPDEGLFDASGNPERVCEPPVQDATQESRKQRDPTEGETMAKSGHSLYVPETLAPNSIVTRDLMEEEGNAPSPAKQRGDRSWQRIPETVPETAGIGTYAESEVPETLAGSGTPEEANELPSPSKDVRGDGLPVQDSLSAENIAIGRSYGEAIDRGNDSDFRRKDSIQELGATETANGNVGGHGPAIAPQIPAVAEAAEKTSETDKMAAAEARDVQQNDDVNESLQPTSETASAHSPPSQEVPETVLPQDMPDTPLSHGVSPHISAVAETPAGESETGIMALGRRDAPPSKEPKGSVEPTSETATPHSLPSQEVPETLFLQDVPETPSSPEVAKTADAIAAGAKDAGAKHSRDAGDSGDEMRNKRSLQESDVVETRKLLPAGSSDSQSTTDDTIEAGAGKDGARAVIENRKHDTPPAESPNSGRKRSADSGTLSPAHSESSGKRLKETLCGETSPIRNHTPGQEGYVSDSGARSEANEVATGPPIVLRGGGGSCGSDDEVVFEPSPNLSGTTLGSNGGIDGGRRYDEDVAGNAHDEDLTADDAVDDSHVSNIFYEVDDGPSTPPSRTTEADRSGGMSSKSVKSVSNPYEHSSHLEIQPDVECTSEPSWNNARTGVATEGNRQTQKVKGNEAPKKNSRRPTSAMMGFGAPSQGKRIARGPSVFGNGAIDTRRKENACRASSNTILAAGRGGSGRGFSVGGTNSAGHGSVNGIANSSTYEETPPSYLVPNTQVSAVCA